MAPIALRPLKSSRAHTHTKNELWDPVSFRNEIIKAEPTIIENGIGLTCFYTFFLRLCVFVRRRSISFQWGSSSDVTEDVLSSAHVQRSSTSNPFWNNIAVVFPRWLICCLFFATVRGTHATIHGIKLSKLRVCVYWIDFWFFFSFFLSFFFYSRFTSLPPPFWFMAECHGGRAGRRLSISSAFFLFIFLFLVFFSLLLLLHILNARHPVGSQREREREREKEKEFPCPAVLQRHRHELRSVALHWIESSEWKKRIQWNKMSVASREKKSTRPFFVIKQSIDNRMEVIDFGPTSDQDVVFKLTPKKK